MNRITLYPIFLQICSTLFAAYLLFWHVMITAIQFNDKHFLQTSIVCDILSNDVLATKPSTKLFIANIKPQLSLSFPRVVPILLCKFPLQKIFNYICRMSNTNLHSHLYIPLKGARATSYSLLMSRAFAFSIIPRSS